MFLADHWYSIIVLKYFESRSITWGGSKHQLANSIGGIAATGRICRHRVGYNDSSSGVEADLK